MIASLCSANNLAIALELLSGKEAHDPWFRTKLLEALNDIQADIIGRAGAASL